MTVLAHLLAALCYLGALVLGVLWRGRPAPVPALLAVGAAVHASGFVVLHSETHPVPLESFAAALSLIGWLTPTSYLLSLRFASVREVAPWVAGLAAVLTACAAAGLGLGRPSAPAGPLGTWSHAHVLLSTLGFSMLALASLAGLAYLTKERALKSKRPPRFPIRFRPARSCARGGWTSCCRTPVPTPGAWERSWVPWGAWARCARPHPRPSRGRHGSWCC